MKRINKIILIVLIIVNIMVLMGQIIPQAAPPFAWIVNIAFLVSTLLLFIILLFYKKKI